MLFLQKKMQKIRALEAPPPDPHPTEAGGFAPRPPLPFCETARPLRISGYAPAADDVEAAVNAKQGVCKCVCVLYLRVN